MRLALGLAVLALVSGCSGGTDESAVTAAPSAASATTPAPTPATTPAPGTLYARAPRPAAVGATGALDEAWLDGTGSDTFGPDIADGIYWGTQAGDGTVSDTLVWDLQQAYFGEFCIAQFGTDDPDACADDYGVVSSPRGLVTVAAAALDEVGDITVVDAETQRNYAIDGTELARLLGGDPAHDGYVYADFAYLVTIAGGTVVSAVQLWTP